jgi:hypothetical protein
MSASPARLDASGWALGAGLLALLTAIAWPLLQLYGMRIDFGDEALRPVIGHMLRAGHSLYGDIWTVHGPLSFLTSYLSAGLVPEMDFDLRPFRAWNLAFGWVACMAVYSSSVHRSLASRATSLAILFALALGVVWEHWINLHFYHSLTALLAAILLATTLVPTSVGRPISRAGMLLAGVLVGLLLLSSYTNLLFLGLASLAMVLGQAGRSGLRSVLQRISLLWVVALVTFAIPFAALPGLIDASGYTELHLVFNQLVYARHIEFELDPVAIFLRPMWPLTHLSVEGYVSEAARRFDAALVAWSLGLIGALIATGYRRRGTALLQCLAPVLLLLALPALSPRTAVGYRGGPFFTALATANLLLTAHLAGALLPEGRGRREAGRRPLAAAAAILGAGLLVLGLSRAGPATYRLTDFMEPRIAHWQRHRARPVDRRMRAFLAEHLSEDAPIAAWVYRPQLYLRLGRMPAFPYYFHYLPWHATFSATQERPQLLDLMKSRPPEAVFYDEWRVWGRYDFNEYAPEIVKLIEERYAPAAGFDALYLRSDLP